MTGIEPAVYGGVMAIAAIIAMAWKFLGFIKDHVNEEIKPIQDNLEGVKRESNILEARIKFAEEVFNTFRLEVATTYSTRADVVNANKPVLDSVDRLTSSVDKMNTRIDRVIEQSNAVKPAARRRPAE